MVAPVTTANSSANVVDKAITAARQVVPVEVQDFARKKAGELAQQVKEEAKRSLTEAADTGANFAADAIVGPLHQALQLAKVMPGADTLMVNIGSLLSKWVEAAKPTALNIKIPATIFKDICYEPEKVNADVIKQLKAIKDLPVIKKLLDGVNSIPEFVQKCFTSPVEVLTQIKAAFGLSDAVAAKPAATSKPAAKSDKAEKPGWIKRCFNWIGSFAGPTETKDIEEAKKKAGPLKAKWLALPPIARKAVVFGGGGFVALKAVTLGFIAVKVALLGGAALMGKRMLFGGNKSEDAEKKKGMFSLLNPLNWFGSKKKATASPVEEAEQAATPRANGGGMMDKLKKYGGHAADLMNRVQNFQTNPGAALAGLGQKFLGGGANAAAQN